MAAATICSRLACGVLLIVAFALAGCHKSPSEPTATVAAGQRPSPSIPSQSIKVATWNIRSGMGINGFTTKTWSSATLNCTDPSQPLNAWGIGLPQTELETIRNDSQIVAMALQEAWNCGNPTNVNGVLGFKAVSREYEGTALLARYGFSTPAQYHQLNRSAWLVSGDVCLDPSCSSSLPVVAAHWVGDPPTMAQQTITFMASRPVPQLLMGDLNVYRIDMWNPSVPCTGNGDPSSQAAIAAVENAGYTDAWKATQSSEGWTGMASRNGCGIPNGNLFKRIDYVYTKGLRAVSTTRFARAAPGADSPSDHVGLIAEVAVGR